jgi:hypothetical protein
MMTSKVIIVFHNWSLLVNFFNVNTRGKIRVFTQISNLKYFIVIGTRKRVIIDLVEGSNLDSEINGLFVDGAIRNGLSTITTTISYLSLEEFTES